MQRLKNLSVHEISLVKAGANRKKYLVLKSESGAPMADNGNKRNTFGDQLAEKFNRIPRHKLEDAEIAIRKARTRVNKADDDQSVPVDDDTQQALRAAFKLLAAHADSLDADTMADFVAALGIEPEDVGDSQADAEDAADGADGDVAMSKDDDSKDDVIGPKPTTPPAKPDDAKKADGDADEDDKDDDATAQDDDAKKADSDKTPAEALMDDEDSEDAKKDGEGMPDFEDATDDDKDAAMAAARKAYADHMQQRGAGKAKKSDADGDDPEDGDVDDDAFKKGNVHKSLSAIFKGMDAKQRAFLEPVFKAQEARMADLEKAQRTLIKKNAETARELREREYVAKAQRDYRHLGPAEEVGAGLMRVAEKDPDGLAAWEAILKSANNRLHGNADAFFGEIGTSFGAPSSDSPEEELRQLVASYVQKDSVGKTQEQIEAEVLKTPLGSNIYRKIQARKAN